MLWIAVISISEIPTGKRALIEGRPHGVCSHSGGFAPRGRESAGAQPDAGRGEMPWGRGSLAGVAGTRRCLTGAHLDLEGQPASRRVTRLSALRKATLGGILPSQQEPGCFNHGSCAAGWTWLNMRARGGTENAICGKQQPNDLEVHRKGVESNRRHRAGPGPF